MSQGTIKFFNRTKRFGFITDDETQKDVFVYITAINNCGYDGPEEGQKVTFDTEPDPKDNTKIRAINVTII